MIHVTIYPACNECSMTDAEVTESVASVYVRCVHQPMCKFIEGQEPIIDTYNQPISSKEKEVDNG